MTSNSRNDYLGNNDPQGVLNEYSRIVDIAVLDSEEITAPKEVDAHIISLDAIKLTLDQFLARFYHVDHNTFQMNKALAEDNALTFVGQTVLSNNFHLPDSVLRLYGLDLGVELDCLDPCSSMEITQQVLYYKSLANMCSVKCALTFNEIIETIVNRTEASTNTTWGSGFGSTGDAVYHQLVVNARFYNANPAVRDIIVKFRYNVGFEGNDEVINIIQSQIRPEFTPASSSGSGSASAP